LFAILAGLLTLAFRGNRAQVRYGLWFSASVKFFIPLALFMSLGSRLQVAPKAAIASLPVSSAIEQVAEPFPETISIAPGLKKDWLPVGIFIAWAAGFAALALIRLRGWQRVRAAVRASTPMEIPTGVEVRTSAGLLEPGVVGMFRPILLLPRGIAERLTAPQLETVLAHELCHVRRRDNLTSAIHMVVEAIFWFHPLVWWIGARLLVERERACDEGVIGLGNAPQVYAEAILNVCKLYVESPLACVAGVTGADLKKRIEAILQNRIAFQLSLAKKTLLTAAGCAVFVLPIALGVLNAPIIAETPAPQETPAEKPYLAALGSVSATTVTIKSRVDGELMSVNFKEGDRVQAGQLLVSIDPRPYQLQVVAAEARLLRDEAETTAAQRTPQLAGRVKADQADLDQAMLRLKYSRISAPITGVTGLRQVDPGNMVYSSADAKPIVTITQLQPIAVVFSIAEDKLPQVLERLKDRSNLIVEAWNRDNTAKRATGRLTAVDNQIDPETGAVKLKAVFDNKDGALFPNQFVNVRLFMR
jgi:multidrug efflux pump subunit AcrA (membrane-fusion protein)/Zn-dependent protease with chaperone function